MNRQKNTAADLHYYSNRLKQKLNLLAASSTAVIEAPPGYGKTTAVQDYLEAMIPQSTDVYWFTAVDEAPGSGYRRLCHEIEKIDSRAGERLLKTGFPNVFTIGEACDALRSVECNRDAWLVIDNFQFLCADLLPSSFLTALVEHGGEGLHIVIVTHALGLDYQNAIVGRNFLHITASDLRLETEDIRCYYALADVGLTEDEAKEVLSVTDGWIIAIYLQLCAYKEAGAFSDKAILQLMDRLVWNKLTGEQRAFFLRLSPFETVTVRQMCGLLGCAVLPDYAADCLSIPFIRYVAEQRRYEPHSILLELIAQKRAERGAMFERECLLHAGDLCRDEGRAAEALGFYVLIKDYERILSLDFAGLIFEEIGGVSFFEFAFDIAQNCPVEIRREHPLSMLRVVWALKAANKETEFAALMDELDGQLDETSLLRAEWLLLSAYRHYFDLDQMLLLVQQAATLFGGTCSRVILPEAPWAFGGQSQLTEFHIKVGEADREADVLEKFIAIYARLTNGHGSGADALFRSELAYFRGDMTDAEVFAYKAVYLAESKQQSVIQLGAAVMLADIARHKADTAGWQNAIGSMERAASHTNQNMPIIRSLLDTVRGILLTELGGHERIAEWLKKGTFSNLMPRSLAGNALYVHSIYLFNTGDFARLIGMLEAMPPEMITSVYSQHVHCVILAAGYISIGNREKSADFLERAAEKALPDELMAYFTGFSWLLQGLAEELIEKKYPLLLDKFTTLKETNNIGFETLHNAMFKAELPPCLTGREREIALLAAQGMRNREIAERLYVTENTVRTHLHTIYQKLDVDRRAKLAEKLK